MKHLKRFVCIIICLCTCVFLVCCGKNNDPAQNNNLMKDPNANYDGELSTSQVLAECYRQFDEKSKKGNGNYFSAKNEDESYVYKTYDEFVYAGFVTLKILSENIKNENSLILSSDEGNANTGDASKIELLYLTRKKQDFKNFIEIYMLFQKKSYNFAENDRYYKMITYKIEYDEKSKETNIEYNLVNSQKSQMAEDSTADNFHFTYESTTNSLIALSFTRLSENGFRYENLDEIPIYILMKNYLLFDFSSNAAINPNINLSQDDDLKNLISRILVQTNESKNLLVEKINSEELMFVSGLSAKFLSVVNAKHIADFNS